MLRGALACGVMIYHLSYWQPFAPPAIIAALLSKLGIYAVEAFFVVSGFSLFVAYQHRPLMTWRGLADYTRARAFRLLPLYAVATLTALAMGVAGSPFDVVGNLTLTFAFWNAAAAIPDGGWSIGVEVVLSVLLPVLILTVTRMGGWFALVLPLGLLWLYIWQAIFGGAWQVYVQVPNHLPAFVAGIYLGMLRVSGLVIGRRAFLAMLTLATVALVVVLPDISDWRGVTEGWPRLFFSALTMAIVGLFALHDFGMDNAAARVAREIGQASYSIYLLHPMVYWLAWHLMSGRWQIAVGCVLATMALSVLTFRLVEWPLIEFGRRRAWRERPERAGLY